VANPGTPGAADVRPLPAHPDIEFEKKRAKRLLRDARAGDDAACATIARVAGDALPDDWTLSLAQLAAAREYGFASWRRLVQYYTHWRHVDSPMDRQSAQSSIEHYAARADWVRNGQAKGMAMYAHSIASTLPRLYGCTNAEVFASPITKDEARWIVARQEGCADWAELTQRARPDPFHGLTADERRAAAMARGERERAEHVASPLGRALSAIRMVDLPALIGIADAHPEILHGLSEWDRRKPSLVGAALAAERPQPRAPGATAIVDWLVSKGARLEDHLDSQLLSWGQFVDADRGGASAILAYWIERGANPDRVWPNGYCTLEHALVWYNISQSRPEFVDVLRARVTRVPESCWVAAGLGDVQRTMQYFDRSGRLRPAARAHRPDYYALGPGGIPFHPEPDDDTIVFDAAWIAVLNGRTNVIDALINRGFPVDTSPYDSTLLHMAVGCGSLPSVECLLRHGADPDKPQAWNHSPRRLAVEMTYSPIDPARERIKEIFRALPPPEAS
jgi:hypothetical protein